MSNTYAAALEAVSNDPALQAALLDAEPGIARHDILAAAGVPTPTRSDINAYVAEHPEIAQQIDTPGSPAHAADVWMCCPGAED
jgi:hypothetical protein